MGLIAAVIFAQYTSIFIERYRRRLRKQVEDLEEAARFRQTQMATMAHDIRSPVAALSGYVSLLEEADIESEGADRPARTNRLDCVEHGPGGEQRAGLLRGAG